MEQIEAIIENIKMLQDETFCMRFDSLEKVVALEKALNEQGISFIMEIKLTNKGCKVIISRNKLDIYGNSIQALHIEEPEAPYHIEKTEEKRVPIGMSDYCDVKKANAYYVDKTRMIEELLQSNDKVTLITRPRRFGKTLNMSMLAEFFDVTKDSRELFEDTYIYQTKYVKEMNQWPVIFLSFFDCKGNENIMIGSLIEHLEDLYAQYYPVYTTFDEKELKDKLCQTYDELKKGNHFSNVVLIKNSLKRLMQFLSKKYKKDVILLIDEYDTPFMSAYAGKYYEEVKDLLTGMLSSALKDNQYLYKGVLTGIQRIAKENLFSGLNNLEVCSMQDEKYKDMFGFTEDETRELLEAHHLELNQNVKDMYDGYTIAGIEIYNPWSVLNYTDKGILAPYWINTGSNELICQLLEMSNDKVKAQYVELLEKGEIKVNCVLEGAYVELKGATQLWALLVHAGYLVVKEKVNYNQYILRIVNGEVKEDLIYIMMRIYAWDEVDVAGMFQLIQDGKMGEFEDAYNEILYNYPSYYDLKDENSYHVLMLGLCIIISNRYEIISNREKGYGRADIYLKSKKGQKDIVIEMKYAESDTEECLLEAADKAMAQILDKSYGKDAMKIGIGNHQKKAKMVWKDIS